MLPDVLSPEAQALAQALLWGERGAMPYDVTQTMRMAGMSHLMAVSGLHVGIVMTLVWMLLKPVEWILILWGPDVIGCHYWMGRVKRLLTIAVVACYVWHIGAPASAVRAALMLSLGLVGWMLQRPSSAWRCLLLAALVLVAADPWSAATPGFQLSFLAVAGILAFRPWLDADDAPSSSPFPSRLPWWLRLVLLSVAAQWFTAPIVAYWFHQVPLLSFVQGVLVVPLMPLLLTLFLLAYAFPTSAVLVWLIELLTAWMEVVARGIVEAERLLLGGHLHLYPTLWDVAFAELLLLCVILYLRLRHGRRNGPVE